LLQIFLFIKKLQKNHKLIVKENISTIITTIDYNFEESSKNVAPKQYKIVQGFLPPWLH
jgi:hypothetical protein